MLNLLLPPTCVYCGKESSGNTELCVNCLAKYLQERRMLCPHCGKTALLCECGCDFAKMTRTRIGGRNHISLTFYTGSQASYDSGRITERMILNLKDKGHFARFFADELADEIERLFEEAGMSPDAWILTYSPRSIENFMKYGLDQGEEVTKHLAKRLGIPFRQTFVRVEGNEQKTLDATDRMINAMETIVPRKSAIKDGEKYLLFDDIITSGATIMASARLLYLCGASEVFPLSIAMSRKKDKQ